MSDTFECHKLAMQLLGSSARLELRVETDPGGNQWQVAEAYAAPGVHGNAPVQARTARHIVSVPYSAATGQISAFQALGELLAAEIAKRDAPPAPPPAEAHPEPEAIDAAQAEPVDEERATDAPASPDL